MIDPMNELLEPTNYSAPSSSDKIVYTTLSIEDGWRIEAHFPKLAPASDRDSVLKWFEAYRRSIHESYPLWTTYFTSDENVYRLEIKRNINARELFNSLQTKIATTWEEDPSYGR